MKQVDWQRLDSAFQEAVSLDGAARRAFLTRLQAEDAALHDELVALLSADIHAQSGLQRVAAEAMQSLPDLLEGARVGAWRVVRRIGMGGMGAVYLAERDTAEFAQRAALKLIRYGPGSAELTRRFQEERRILARLEHPNIARLLDGGTTEQGDPWFCMEYIEGQSLTEHCEAHALSLQQRLALFADVCAAVHHAHKSLIVHRDLKPNNILIAANGTVKLLDFGIAKLIAEDAGNETALTKVGVRAMTPRYASPEQIRGEPVTTATDVYSLGVILYELLCGQPPYRAGVTGATLEADVLSTMPARPSDAARQSARERASRLTGDLDNICLMALRKEPERRYASVEALREDILLHLSGRPRASEPRLRWLFAEEIPGPPSHRCTGRHCGCGYARGFRHALRDATAGGAESLATGSAEGRRSRLFPAQSLRGFGSGTVGRQRRNRTGAARSGRTAHRDGTGRPA
ncbi:MAG: serine/threonine-protein kinase [Longimicrobiales bacterium]